MVFADRVDAGRRLATRLADLRGTDTVVLGLPRGGVPVAAEVAIALDLPLDVIVVRKLGVPWQPELAMGAIGEGDVTIVSDEIGRSVRVSDRAFREVQRRERDELRRRVLRFRGHDHRLDLSGRTALVIDDGVATGSTARAACRVARAQGATAVILAVPVAPLGWAPEPGEVDRFVCLEAPDRFGAVGRFYADFSPTTDDEVNACLQRTAASANQPPGDAG